MGPVISESVVRSPWGWNSLSGRCFLLVSSLQALPARESVHSNIFFRLDKQDRRCTGQFCHPLL